MLTPEQRGLAAVYLDFKAGVSAQNDRLMGGCPRRAVPALAGPAEAAAYFAARGNPYTGDPLWGAIDFYTHPERVQAALDLGPEQMRRTFIDCDDVALWYHAVLRQIPGYQARVVTLIDGGVVGSHVICVYEAPAGGDPRARFGALDTNGHRHLPDLDEATLCQVWTSLYGDLGYRYLGALDTPTPF